MRRRRSHGEKVMHSDEKKGLGLRESTCLQGAYLCRPVSVLSHFHTNGLLQTQTETMADCSILFAMCNSQRNTRSLPTVGSVSSEKLQFH